MADNLPMRGAGRRSITKAGREQGRRLDEVRDEVEIAEFQIAGAQALAARIMERAVELDDHRKEVAGADTMLNVLCAGVEETFINQAQRIQRSLFQPFGR